MRRIVLLLLLAGACAPPERVPPPAAIPARAPRAASPTAAPTAPPRARQYLACIVTSPGAPVAVYASMQDDAPVAFEVPDGERGDVLSSATLSKGGKSYLYYEVRFDAGRGWIWDEQVRLVPHALEEASTDATPPEPRLSVETEVVEHETDVPSDSLQPPVAQAAVAEEEEINEPGQGVVVSEHLGTGKVTIVEYYSPFCGPCMRTMPKLRAIAQRSRRIVLRTVNINRPQVKGIDWSSPAAQQFGLSQVPRVEVYDENGTLVASDEGAWSYLASVKG